MQIQIGDEITVRAHWANKTATKCKVIGMWSTKPDCPFIDVRSPDDSVHCVRRDDIIPSEN